MMRCLTCIVYLNRIAFQILIQYDYIPFQAQTKSQSVKRWGETNFTAIASGNGRAMRGDFSWGESNTVQIASGNGNMILPTANGSSNYFWEDANKPVSIVTTTKSQETVRLPSHFLSLPFTQFE